MPGPAVSVVPESLGLRLRYVLAGLIFFLGYRVFGLRRGVIRGNLARSFPQMDAAQRDRIRCDFIARQSEILAELDYSRAIRADELRERVRLIDPGGVLQGTERRPPVQLRMAAAAAVIGTRLGPGVRLQANGFAIGRALFRWYSHEVRGAPAAIDPDPSGIAHDPPGSCVRAGR
jgi:hypothetical protein